MNLLKNKTKTNKQIKKTDYNSKITEIKGKTPSITGLTTVALTAVENKLPNVSNLVGETDYDATLLDIGFK